MFTKGQKITFPNRMRNCKYAIEFDIRRGEEGNEDRSWEGATLEVYGVVEIGGKIFIKIEDEGMDEDDCWLVEEQHLIECLQEYIPSHGISGLPKYWAVNIRDENDDDIEHPLREEFVNWFKEKARLEDKWAYAGYDGNENNKGWEAYDSLDGYDEEVIIISLEQWKQAIDRAGNDYSTY